MDTSWLSGRHFDRYGKLIGEIDTKLPYISVEPEFIEGGYFAQEQAAEQPIAEIHAIWLQGGNVSQALLKWINQTF